VSSALSRRKAWTRVSGWLEQIVAFRKLMRGFYHGASSQRQLSYHAIGANVSTRGFDEKAETYI